MKAIIICPVDPFPPRNGVTIPIANYARLLSNAGYGLTFLIIGNENLPTSEETTRLGDVRHLQLSHSAINRLYRVAAELVGIRPYFELQCNDNEIDKYLKELGSPDLIVASPINMLGIAKQVKERTAQLFGLTPKLIAGISDCYTSVLRTLPPASTRSNLRDTVKYRLRWLRSYNMQRLEVRLLKNFDRVLVQTERDREWLNRLSNCSLNSIVRVLTNGVAKELFENKPGEKDVLFVGNLRAESYRLSLLWFIRNVWEKFPSINMGVLHVYTSGVKLDSRFEGYRNRSDIVLHENFVAKLEDIYKGKAICIAPVFKDYGFINKVAEAMAAGLVVIGDRSAFNGICGFKDRVHGIVANTAEEFIEALSLADATEQREKISESARVLAQNEFDWVAKSPILLI